MLQLKQAYAAYPAGPVQHLRVENRTIIVYPSADAVILVDALSLKLEHVLALSEAFPSISHTISCTDIDSGMKYIFAASGSRIAVWALSELQNKTWRVHSTLTLPGDAEIVTLDGQAGLLAVGSNLGLSVYTLVLENDLPTWSRKWSIRNVFPTMLRFAPSFMYIAFLSKKERVVTLYSTASGRQTQQLIHPRRVKHFGWRHSRSSNRDDLLLYTVAEDSTLRIFLPVLDSPQHLQLHAALDPRSSVPINRGCDSSKLLPSSIFWLETDIVGHAIKEILQNKPDDDVRIRRLRDIKEEGWDLFLRIFEDGSVLVTAVANIDRRPPTLLKQFTLQHFPPKTVVPKPSHLEIVPNPDPTLITMIMGSPLSSTTLSLLEFFDPHSKGMTETARLLDRLESDERIISKLVRTPEGHGLGVLREGRGDIWKAVNHSQRLVRSRFWRSAEKIVVLQEGATFAAYIEAKKQLTLFTDPPADIALPEVSLIFSMPSPDNNDYILAITPDFSILHLQATYEPIPNLSLRSQCTLPVPHSSKLHMVIPVDPMAWGTGRSWVQHDVLLSVSFLGELAFWVPEPDSPKDWRWRCTGRVKTGRSAIRKACCSSAKKTVLVVPRTNSEELTIWDSKESEFAIGLELSKIYGEKIQDLDWTSTPDMQSILAVGFKHRVELLCQQRSTYFDDTPGWATMAVVDIGSFIPYQISDSIWLSSGSLVIGAGHQLLLYGTPTAEPGHDTPESLFEHVARFNGPLDDYHPQIMLQCLIWGKTELVKEVIIKLSRMVVEADLRRGEPMRWNPLPVEQYFFKDKDVGGNNILASLNRYDSLFSNEKLREPTSEDDTFSRSLVEKLISVLENRPLPHLSPNEQTHLLTLIQATLEIDEQRRALDANGLRYLISMRSFYILNRRASGSSTPESKGPSGHGSGKRQRIRYRDMTWAFHSESQDLLLAQSVAACGGKMTWSDARALGVPIWLTSVNSLRSHIENIARNEYAAGDDRDPTACSLYYFALGKPKLVHGLWRQAAWHKEQSLMLRFLSNDFSQERWRTAAMKNAFALLGKQRFEYAAAFFLLGGSLKDAVNVCIKQLGDFQLAIAIARLVEQGNEGPVFTNILHDIVLPTAFREGNRWLASWAFWSLKRRDLAVRVLLTPLQDIASLVDIRVDHIGEPHYDDPGLALLFSQLRSKTLQAAKGTSEIPGSLEFNFVLQMARVFCRMGCHVLALDLVKSWSFDQPATFVPKRGVSQETSGASFFNLANRRSSILIDLPLLSDPPTRSTSPEMKQDKKATSKEDDDVAAVRKRAGLGSLLKSAKQAVQIPEFDMNSFV